MGTDIHPIVEVRRKGVWHTHNPKTECPYYYEFSYAKPGTGPLTKIYDLDAQGNRVRSKWDKCKTRLPECFGSRNYAKFAILANVRNDSMPFIDENRGLPDDLAPGSRAWKDSGEYDHSHGWVNLTEMMNYDTSQTYQEEGIISAKDYETIRDTGAKPDSWSGGIGGQGIAVVSPEVYDALDPSVTVYVGNKYAPASPAAPARFFVQHRWTETVDRMLDNDLAEMIDYMKPLIPKGGTSDDVRLLFYFDS